MVDMKMLLTLLISVFLMLHVQGTNPWSDEFDSLDTTLWTVHVSADKFDGQLMQYVDRPENIFIENGALVIRPLKQSYNRYTSAKLTSKYSWKYGRVEVRAELPKGEGLRPLITLVPRDETLEKITLLEAKAGDNHVISSGIKYGVQEKTSGEVEMDCSTQTYHTYTLDWTPTELVYRVDGVAYYREDISTLENTCNKKQPFDQYFYIELDLAIKEQPTKRWMYPSAEMHVDYVKVYPLEDITDGKCSVSETADYADVCKNINWLCNEQTLAKVVDDCTNELLSCCQGNVITCDAANINRLATPVYDSYSKQLNNPTSCWFDGTASEAFELKEPSYPEMTTCSIKQGVTNSQMCEAVKSVCSGIGITGHCSSSRVRNIKRCCFKDAESCDNVFLRDVTEKLARSHYKVQKYEQNDDLDGICVIKFITC